MLKTQFIIMWFIINFKCNYFDDLKFLSNIWNLIIQANCYLFTKSILFSDIVWSGNYER